MIWFLFDLKTCSSESFNTYFINVLSEHVPSCFKSLAVYNPHHHCDLQSKVIENLCLSDGQSPGLVSYSVRRQLLLCNLLLNNPFNSDLGSRKFLEVVYCRKEGTCKCVVISQNLSNRNSFLNLVSRFNETFRFIISFQDQVLLFTLHHLYFLLYNSNLNDISTALFPYHDVSTQLVSNERAL